ncbi:hypothetical protein GCM10009772_43260 [Pseudonocardia alni subsp. carboxydivorans]|uniref:Ribbon-helix-helix protein, CopG family n=2 Tax=Pseudonocardia alni TaxID=33907 RepID=A0ABU9AB40_PSEA5
MTGSHHDVLAPSDRPVGDEPQQGGTPIKDDSTGVPVAPDTLHALEAAAEKQGVSPSQLVERLLETNAGTENRSVTQAPANKVSRLSVNINHDTYEAIQELARERGVTVTEAVRRLVGYGAIVYRSNRDGQDILLRRDGKTERVMLLD